MALNKKIEEMSLDELEVALDQAVNRKSYQEMQWTLQEAKDHYEEAKAEVCNYQDYTIQPLKDEIIKRFKAENMLVYSTLVAKKGTKKVVDKEKLANTLSQKELLQVSNVVLKRLEELQENSNAFRSDAIQDCITREELEIKDINIIKR